MKKSLAFTLAEVLITLAVIGVVAVLAIGIFMPKIQDKVLATQAKTAKIKFTKAMEQMALNNKIGPLYQDTEEFVSELQNYLKVAKVCKNDELKDCFGYEEFDTGNGETFSLEDLDDASVFQLDTTSTGNNTDFSGNTVGLVTIDGTPMVLAWNKKCEILEPGVYQWGGNTNISTKCVAAVMDVNSTKRPNKSGRDIVFLNAEGVSNLCVMTFTYNGTTYTWGCPFVPTPLTYSQCMDLKRAGKISNCVDSSYIQWTDYDGDRWAGTVQACGGKSKMPSAADLAALANYLYNRTDIPTSSYNSTSNLTMDTAKLASLNTAVYDFYFSRQEMSYNSGVQAQYNKTSDYFSFWADTESSAYSAACRNFNDTWTTYYGNTRHSMYSFGVCKAD